MALAESLFARLKDSAAVTAIVGSADACRVFPGVAPDGQQPPYVVYSELPFAPDLTHDGASASGNRMVQLSCVAGTYIEARNLGAAIVAALDGHTLPGGEVVLSAHDFDGFSDSTDQYLRIVEAEIFSAPAPVAA